MSEIDILSFGETMAMFVAEQTGELAEVGHFHKRIAGADSNVAIGLSRLGFNVAWLGGQPFVDRRHQPRTAASTAPACHRYSAGLVRRHPRAVL